MKTDVTLKTPAGVASDSGIVSSGVLSLAQQVLSEWGWEDLRPAMIAAEQVDHEVAMELQAAQAAYEEVPQEHQRTRLEKALDRTIEKLQADYHQVQALKEKAQRQSAKSAQSAATSYLGQLSEWAWSGLQQFFGSDEASSVERYEGIAKNRQETIAGLTRYRQSLKTAWDEEKGLTEIEEEEEVIELSTEEGEKIPVAAMSDHNRHLLWLPLTGEFRVNSYTLSNQTYPQVATLSTGEVVATWQSLSQDKSGTWGIYAQRYSANGIAQGGEFRVNTVTNNDQTSPSIASLSTGDFVVTWQSSGQDGAGLGIYAQRYFSNGTAQGGEFRVNTYTSGDQEASSIAGLSTGDFVVTWQSLGDGGGRGIYAQRYFSNGTAQGGEFQVNTYTNNDQTAPSVASLSTGDFVVVWQSTNQETATGIYAQRYSASGIAQGGEFHVNTFTQNAQTSPRIVGLSSGGFVVTWQSNSQDSGGTYGIYAQRYDSSATPQGGEFRVNTYIQGDQTSPAVAVLSSGSFIISWASAKQDGSKVGIYAQRFSSLGEAEGTEFQLNTYTIGDQDFPALAALSGEDFIGVWNSKTQDPDGSEGVYGRLIRSEQAPMLQQNSLTIRDGETVVITSSMLNATDADLDFSASNLNFTLSSVQQGHFALVNASTVEITQFTQAQVAAGQICFVHNGGNQAPSYNVSVSDGQLSSSPQIATINFNFRPVIVNNTLTLNAGQTLSLTSAMLSATDGGSLVGSLNFTVSNVQRGQFESVSTPGIAITQFTQSQIQAGQICFVPDSSNVAPSYQVSVSDGALSSALTTGNIVFNQHPVLTQNTMSLKDGDTLVVNSTMLSATDDQTMSGALVFTVSSVQNGQFESVSSPGVALTQFTQAQVQSSQIRFVHAGSNVAPSYQVSVGDGTVSTTPVSAAITFNQHPVLVNNTLSINDGATLTLTSAMLSATDDQTSASALNFTVSNVQHGQFEFITNPGVAITQFTQAEIQASQVRFIHDGSNVTPNYQISVSDGAINTIPASATIAFNQRPILVNNTLSISDGATLTVTSGMLSAMDDQTPVAALSFTVSNVQHGQFELMTNPGVAQTQFTQAQVQANQVRFVHDGSNVAPSYQISVSDGVLTSPVAVGNVMFNQRPLLINNAISLKDGDSLVVNTTMLSATDDKTVAGALAFTVTNVQQGQFELVSAPGIGITQWTQAQVQAGEIRFVHNGSNVAPSYQVSVSDGVTNTSAISANITFNQRPVLVNKAMALKDGETLTITSAMLNATDDKTASDSLVFIVSTIQNGQFELVGAPGVAVAQFTQAQIQASQVQFVHAGNNQAPSFNVSVSDGVLVTPAQAAGVTFDYRPVIGNNRLTVQDGQTVVLNSSMISGTDNGIAVGSLTFTLSNVQHGRFELATNPGVTLTQFTQTQVQAGQVRFVHDGSNTAPSYQISVSDGTLTSPIAAGNVAFDQRPLLVNNAISLKDGDSILVNATMLSATDDKTTAGALSFTVSAVQQARFELVTNPGVAITQFTQTQIQAGDVRFVHDGSNLAPSYQVSVSDGSLSTSPVAGNVAFDQRPVLVNKAMALKDGETLTITSAMLNSTDDKAASSALTFTVSTVQNGQFELVSAAGTLITQFTQAQIQAAEVVFVHAGNNQAPSFNVSVSDGILATPTQAAGITFDYRPVIGNNRLTIQDGQTLVLNSSMISGTDNGAAVGSLTFTLSNVQRGRFELATNPGVALTQFTQTQVQAGQVRFVHDGSNTAPSYQISVSDGVLSTASVDGTITFDQRPVLVNNVLTLKDGDSVVVNTTMLSAADDKTTAGVLVFTVSNVQHGQFEDKNASGVAITQFTQAQVQTGDIRFVHDGGNVAPSYQISVSDGQLSSPASAATVTFNRRPVITTNQLAINEGEAVVLNATMLAVNDDQNSSALTLNVTGLQGGYFALTGAPTTPITQFTFAQVQAGQIVFVQSGVGIAPAYALTVNDGVFTSSLSSAVVAFNPRPILLYNSLNLKGQGLTINITTTELRASDNQPDMQLTFTASNVQNGHFELTTALGVNATQFTQADITAGRVRFVRDNLVDLPSYSISVSDGILSTTPTAAVVTFNDRPMININTLSLRDGESVILTSGMLHATDDNPDSQLMFTVANLQGGRFELTTAPGVNITQFTQQQIGAGQVRFVHAGLNQAPSYTVSVSDGELDTVPVAAAVTFNSRPVISTNTLMLNDGESVVLTPVVLNTTDDQSAGGLTYTVNNVQQGRFELLTNAGVAITQFTHQQVIDGQVRFVHAGGNIAPSYQISVNDGVLSSTPVSATIIFNQHPILVNNELSLKDNETVVITSAMVNATDDQALASELQFTVGTAQNGQFELINSSGIAISQFTQAQVQAGQVRFVHAGNNQPPSYTLSVSDGKLTTTAQSATVSFKHRPVLTTHHLVITQGKATVITSNMLSVTSDSPDTLVVFSVNNIQHGRFTRVSTPDIAITQFTQQEIKAGQIQFVPDDSGLTPDYMLGLSDSFFTLPPVSANVTVSPAPPASPPKSIDWVLIGGSAGGGAALVVLLCAWYRCCKRRSQPSVSRSRTASKSSRVELISLDSQSTPPVREESEQDNRSSSIGLLSSPGQDHSKQTSSSIIINYDPVSIPSTPLLSPINSESKQPIGRPSSPTVGMIDGEGEVKINFSITYAKLRYNETDKLGSGGYGIVYKGKYNNNIVAIKKLHAKYLGEEALKELRQEASIMVSTPSNYLPRLYGLCLEEPNYCLVMELMPKGSLYDLLQNRKEAWPLSTTYKIALNVVYGLDELHNLDILHRDLKSLNVLLDDQMNAKVTDFGLAKIKSEIQGDAESDDARGTFAWMAPELFEKNPVATKAVDMYAYGMVLWELISMPYQLPFHSIASTFSSMKKAKQSRGIHQEVIPKSCPEELAPLIRSCWQMTPAKRPTARDLITSLEPLFESAKKIESSRVTVETVVPESKTRSSTQPTTLPMEQDFGKQMIAAHTLPLSESRPDTLRPNQPKTLPGISFLGSDSGRSIAPSSMSPPSDISALPVGVNSGKLLELPSTQSQNIMAL